ncbi:MAG: hypothetical protein GY765_10225 [bacterium]|nr:hypothetical protein [bacterium]
MKKNLLPTAICLVFFILAMVSVVGADEPKTAQQIITKCAEAMGGMEKIKAIKTFRQTTQYEGRAHPTVVEILRPEKFRNNIATPLVFDGKRCARLTPGKEGKPGTFKLLEPHHFPHFNIDTAFVFPVFFDYPATYHGVVEEDGKKAHKLVLKMPLGPIIAYFLDVETFLPFKVYSTLEEGGETHHPVCFWSNYKEFSGILYPATVGLWWGGDKPKPGTVKSVELNVSFKKDHFSLPKDIK